VYIFDLFVATRKQYIISERGRGLGHVTPRIFGIPSSISPKPVEIESSKLVHNFFLALPTILRYYISGSGHSLDDVTPGKFGLSYIISPKRVKPETSQIRLVPSHKTEE